MPVPPLCPSDSDASLYFPVRSPSRADRLEGGQAVVPRTRSAGEANLNGADAIGTTGEVCLTVGWAILPVPVVHVPPERVHMGSQSAPFHVTRHRRSNVAWGRAGLPILLIDSERLDVSPPCRENVLRNETLHEHGGLMSPARYR